MAASVGTPAERGKKAMTGKGRICFFIILGLAVTGLSLPAQDVFSQAEEAFMSNQPDKVVTLLAPLVDSGTSRKQVYLYQGVALQQLGRYSDAVSALSRGVEKTLPPHDVLYFNMGNNYFMMNRDSDADRAYGRAIQENSGYTPAYLNRANTRMRLGRHNEALGDYRFYLLQNPGSSQRATIEELIRRVEGYLASEEQRKQDEEAARLAEEARQKALLDSVLQSLQNLDSETANLQAGSEDIETFDPGLDIAD